MNPTTGTGRARASLVLVLLLGLLVRLPSILAGYPESQDVQTLKGWGQIIQARGLENTYDGTNINYPPVLLYLIGGAARVETDLGPWDLNPRSDRSLVALTLHIATTLADLLTTLLLAAALWPRSSRLATLVAGLYAFNPTIFYVSAVWGQVDSIYTFFLVAAVVALQSRGVLPAWLIYALALATKLQSVALAPLMLAWSLARHGARRLASGLAIAGSTLALLCAPWLLSGHALALIQAYFTTSPPEGRAVVSAYNLWYLLVGGDLLVSSGLHPLNLPLSYRTIGNLLFALLAALIAWLAIRRARNLALPSAALALSLFLVLTDIHERHAYPALAFLLWAAAEQTLNRQSPGHSNPPHSTRHPTLWWAYAALTITTFFNLITILPFSPDLGLHILREDPASPLWVQIKTLSYATAAANLLILAYLIQNLLHPPSPDPVIRNS